MSTEILSAAHRRPRIAERISLPYAVTHPAAAEVQVVNIGDLHLENGELLPETQLAYETWGRLNARADNAILVQHALTGSSHAATGANGAKGWWDTFIGPGKALDTNTYFVVAANILGGCYGSTGPGSRRPEGWGPARDGLTQWFGQRREWGSQFPFLTLRDTVRAESRLADALGISRWHTVIGGSMGGARALEWAVTYPERVARVAVIAASASSTAEQIALARTQVEAIRLDPQFYGGDYYPGPQPRTGLSLARKIAHVSYRSESELGARFGRGAQPGERTLGARLQLGRGRYQVESYLDHQGETLVDRFDANSYIALTEALMSHDIGRGRGGIQAALGRVGAEVFLAYVDSDRLYLPEQTLALADGLNRARGVADSGDDTRRVSAHRITSAKGHDGFLTDIAQLEAPFARFLA